MYLLLSNNKTKRFKYFYSFLFFMANKSNDVIEKNLEKMFGENEGDRCYALKESPESVGGNAGSFRGMPCYASAFFYIHSTGEILYFGNFQYVPDRIKNDRLNSEACFRFAVDIKHKKDILVDLVEPVFAPAPTPAARDNLEQTKEAYNQRIGVPKDYFD